MIGRPELSRIAVANGVRERAQEKDYVLTWLLAARAALGPPGLVFKGGTALRRCYFSGYRYSEDLDFTAAGAMTEAGVVSAIDAWCEWVYDAAGVRANRKPVGSPGSTTHYVAYVGPLRAQDGRDIKIDVAIDEQIRHDDESRELIREYSDLPSDLPPLGVHSLTEIWAEKVRSLMQRTEPRDLYDLDRLAICDDDLPILAAELFREKARAKGLDPDRLEDILPAREETLRRWWKSRLGNQVRELPEFDGVWRRVRRALRQARY